MSTRILYIVKSSGVYKVGLATNLAARISSLQTGCPAPIVPVLAMALPADLAREAEKWFHERFRKEALHGEWFNVLSREIQTAYQEAVERFGGEPVDALPSVRKAKRAVRVRRVLGKAAWETKADEAMERFAAEMARKAKMTRAELAAERKAQQEAQWERTRARARVQMAELAEKKRLKAEAKAQRIIAAGHARNRREAVEWALTNVEISIDR